MAQYFVFTGVLDCQHAKVVTIFFFIAKIFTEIHVYLNETANFTSFFESKEQNGINLVPLSLFEYIKYSEKINLYSNKSFPYSNKTVSCSN